MKTIGPKRKTHEWVPTFLCTLDDGANQAVVCEHGCGAKITGFRYPGVGVVETQGWDGDRKVDTLPLCVPDRVQT